MKSEKSDPQENSQELKIDAGEVNGSIPSDDDQQHCVWFCADADVSQIRIDCESCFNPLISLISGA